MTTLNTGLVDNLYFFTDSLAAQPTNMVYLSSNMNDWVEEDIKQALEDSGIDEDDVDRVYSNLVDYVDEDYVPAGGLEACCGEAVPMVNEVIFSYLLQDGPGGVNMGYVVDVEWYYPFAAKPADDAPSFTMDYTVTFTPKPGTETAFVPDDPASATASLNVNSADQLDTVNFGEMEQGVYVFAPDETVDVGFDVEVDVTIKAGDDVDRVGDPGVDGDGIVFSIDLPGISQGVNVQTQRWAECVDPRFNWETDNVEQWVLDSMLSMLEGVAGDYEPEPTPAAENSYAKWLVSHPDHDFVKKNFDAATLRNCASYVANAPIRSVGELGYLCVKPWYTIRLYDHNEPLYDVNPKFHRVFDHLTVHPLAARTSRGLVNINTRHRDVLTTVYYDMPVDEYKEPDDQTRLTWAEAEAISELIITEQPFTNLTDLGTVTTWGDYVSSAREVAKEAPIRNAAGLLTARENLFVIMVAGGPFSRGVGQVAYRGKTGDWLGTQRAVAVVWRDPVPDPDSGKCPVMLRYFKWLED